jgi:hypothetical protein
LRLINTVVSFVTVLATSCKKAVALMVLKAKFIYEKAILKELKKRVLLSI